MLEQLPRSNLWPVATPEHCLAVGEERSRFTQARTVPECATISTTRGQCWRLPWAWSLAPLPACSRWSCPVTCLKSRWMAGVCLCFQSCPGWVYCEHMFFLKKRDFFTFLSYKLLHQVLNDVFCHEVLLVAWWWSRSGDEMARERGVVLPRRVPRGHSWVFTLSKLMGP